MLHQGTCWWRREPGTARGLPRGRLRALSSHSCHRCRRSPPAPQPSARPIASVKNPPYSRTSRQRAYGRQVVQTNQNPDRGLLSPPARRSHANDLRSGRQGRRRHGAGSSRAPQRQRGADCCRLHAGACWGRHKDDDRHLRYRASGAGAAGSRAEAAGGRAAHCARPGSAAPMQRPLRGCAPCPLTRAPQHVIASPDPRMTINCHGCARRVAVHAHTASVPAPLLRSCRQLNCAACCGEARCAGISTATCYSSR